MRVFVFDALDRVDLSRCLPKLSENRRAKVLRLRNETDRRQSAAAELLLRHALMRMYQMDKLPEISLNQHGKPYFTEFPDIFFNLSHCREGVVCGISDTEIGVDIQDYRPVSTGVIERVLCRQEKEYLWDCSNTQKGFAYLWSRKEACLKMLGCGIAETLSTMNTLNRSDITSFEFEKYAVSVCCTSEKKSEIERIELL